MRNKNSYDNEPGIAARFGLAYERLAKQDAETNAWLDKVCRRPDPDEYEKLDRIYASLPADPATATKHSHAPGRCKVWGCNRKSRAKGMCDMHYRRDKEGRPLHGTSHRGMAV